MPGPTDIAGSIVVPPSVSAPERLERIADWLESQGAALAQRSPEALAFRTPFGLSSFGLQPSDLFLVDDGTVTLEAYAVPAVVRFRFSTSRAALLTLAAMLATATLLLLSFGRSWWLAVLLIFPWAYGWNRLAAGLRVRTALERIMSEAR